MKAMKIIYNLGDGSKSEKNQHFLDSSLKKEDNIGLSGVGVNIERRVAKGAENKGCSHGKCSIKSQLKSIYIFFLMLLFLLYQEMIQQPFLSQTS